MSNSNYRLGKAIRTPVFLCPKCGEKLDAATEAVPADEAQARIMEQDDITVCAYCAAPLILDKSALRMMTNAEMKDAPPVFHDMIYAIRRLRG